MIRQFNTKEELVLTTLWSLGKGLVQDIINELPEPKPHYNTISSIVRKLQAEGFISHEAQGRSHLYVPVIKKDAYRDFMWNHLHQTYFNGSDEEMKTYANDKFGVEVSNVVEEKKDKGKKKKKHKKKDKKKGKKKKHKKLK